MRLAGLMHDWPGLARTGPDWPGWPEWIVRKLVALGYDWPTVCNSAYCVAGLLTAHALCASRLSCRSWHATRRNEASKALVFLPGRTLANSQAM